MPDPRADLFSLGAVLYELLTGTEPALVSQSAVSPPSTSRSDIPLSLDKLILSMLAPDREERPRSAQEVLDELRSIEKTADLDSLIALHNAGFRHWSRPGLAEQHRHDDGASNVADTSRPQLVVSGSPDDLRPAGHSHHPDDGHGLPFTMRS